MTLDQLVSIADDIPYCGTRPPRPPWPGPHGPSPNPWGEMVLQAHVEVALYAAITLRQLAKLASGGEAQRLGTVAQQLFDDPFVPSRSLN